MELFPYPFFSLNVFLEEFSHLDMLLFLHIFHIFFEMKASSSSSSNTFSESSLEESSRHKAQDFLLDVGLEDNSLDDETFLSF